MDGLRSRSTSEQSGCGRISFTLGVWSPIIPGLNLTGTTGSYTSTTSRYATLGDRLVGLKPEARGRGRPPAPHLILESAGSMAWFLLVNVRRVQSGEGCCWMRLISGERRVVSRA